MTDPQRKRAIGFILVNLTIDAMGIGLIAPVMPDLISEINGGTLGNAAVWGGLLATSYAVMQFIFGPILGSLSDRYGRRPVLLLSLLIMSLDYLVMAVAGSIWLLFAARIVGGIMAATQATATAFVADISDPKEKSANFGLLAAAFGVGFILGPIVGGLLGEFGTQCAFIVYPSTWAYFTKEAYGWSPGMVGVSLAMFGFGVAIVQGGIIRIALKRFGERGTIVYGMMFNLGAFILLTLIGEGWIALAFIPLTSLGAVVNPALQGLMSQRAANDQQGELQGVITSAKSMAMILSPVAMTQIFWAFTTETGPYFPGAAFALSAFLMVACLAVFLTRPRHVPA